MKVEGKVALITGAARGLGKAYAEALLGKGAKVAILDILQEEGTKTEEEFKAKHGAGCILFIHCDVRKQDDLRAAIDQVIDTLGPLEILINNAGVNEQDLGMFEEVVAVNVAPVIGGTYYGVERMRKDKGGNGGVVINIASVAGLTPIPALPSYSASKHAVVGFTRAYAGVLDFQGSSWGIRLNCLCPTFTWSPMTVPLEERVTNDPLMKDAFFKYCGWASIEDVLKAMLSLVEDDSHQGTVMVARKGGPEVVTFQG